MPASSASPSARCGETANHLRDAWKENYITEDEYATLANLARRALGITIRWHTYLKHCPEQPSHHRKPRGPKQA